jgi:hypothetical protein
MKLPITASMIRKTVLSIGFSHSSLNSLSKAFFLDEPFNLQSHTDFAYTANPNIFIS